MNKNDKRPPRFALVIVIIFIALMIGVGLIGTLETVLRWLIIAGLMIAFLAVIGIQVTGLPAAILIDSRYNKMSLSRLQITLWTILVLSAYFTIALDRNIPGLLDPKKGLGEPLNISFPPELLVALGISAASFAGSSLIKSVKMGKEVNIELRESQMKEAKEAVNKASKTVDKAREELTKKVQALENAKVKAATAADRKQAEALVLSAEKDRDQAFADVKTAEADLEKARKNLEDIEKTQKETEGLLHRNTDPAEAQWVDIFRGEEIGNYKLIDMSKVQMFLFTIAVVFTYGVAVCGLLRDATALQAATGVVFPPFSPSLNGLLGISHAGYLTVKTTDHTKVES